MCDAANMGSLRSRSRRLVRLRDLVRPGDPETAEIPVVMLTILEQSDVGFALGVALVTRATMVAESPRCIAILPGSTLIRISFGTSTAATGTSGCARKGHTRRPAALSMTSDRLNTTNATATSARAPPKEAQGLRASMT